MLRTNVPSARVIACVSLAISLAILAILLACGGGTSSTSPGGSFGSGGAGSGGSGFGSGGSGGGGNFGSGGTNAGTITGTVIDATTNRPIVGTVVVALESETGNSFTIVQQVTPDAQGNFVFNNVASGNYAIAVSALGTNQVPLVPVVLVSGGASALFSGGQNITPGTNVGTIPVPEPPATSVTPFGSGPSALLQTLVQTDTTTPVKLTFGVSEQINNFVFPIPFPQGTPTATATTGASCGGTACASTTLSVAPWTPEIGVFNGTSTQFTASTTSPNFAVTVNAFSTSTGQPDCAPSSQTSTALAVNPGQTTVVPTFTFGGCQ